MKKTDFFVICESQKEKHIAVIAILLRHFLILAGEVEKKIKPKKRERLIWKLSCSFNRKVKALQSEWNLHAVVVYCKASSEAVELNSLGFCFQTLTPISTLSGIWILRDGRYVSCFSDSLKDYGTIHAVEELATIVVDKLQVILDQKNIDAKDLEWLKESRRRSQNPKGSRERRIIT